jgi:hypothetical protein
MRPTAAIMLAVTVLAVGTAILANFSAAGADELNDLRADQQTIRSRIDQLAQPAGPQAGDQPGGSAATGAGSFPRSFLIPGTDTSVRVGGFVGGTMSYRPQ